MNGPRYLVVIADDYGIGPATSQAILDLAREGRVNATVLLVNSPYAEQAVQAWRRLNVPLELGWHPCLTMDPPVLPAGRVPSLVGGDGCLHPLGTFLRRVFLGQIHAAEVAAELRAQYDRFLDLVGQPPTVVNSHQHVQLFDPVGPVLLDLLQRRRPLPYVRRVREPWRMLLRVPGARVKRAFLSAFGRRDARRQERAGFPGNDWLAGITDPPCVTDTDFFVRWLTRVPGRVVELACHPGHWDATLVGRDCSANDGRIDRRVGEFRLMQDARFPEACRRAGFTCVTPAALLHLYSGRDAHAA
jgi:predicted glycoside hydrolase/deacetylase ChbG (UPF0249 family)